jgi:hypothetical protein
VPDQTDSSQTSVAATSTTQIRRARTESTRFFARSIGFRAGAKNVVRAGIVAIRERLAAPAQTIRGAAAAVLQRLRNAAAGAAPAVRAGLAARRDRLAAPGSGDRSAAGLAASRLRVADPGQRTAAMIGGSLAKQSYRATSAGDRRVTSTGDYRVVFQL